MTKGNLPISSALAHVDLWNGLLDNVAGGTSLLDSDQRPKLLKCLALDYMLRHPKYWRIRGQSVSGHPRISDSHHWEVPSVLPCLKRPRRLSGLFYKSSALISTSWVTYQQRCLLCGANCLTLILDGAPSSTFECFALVRPNASIIPPTKKAATRVPSRARDSRLLKLGEGLSRFSNSGWLLSSTPDWLLWL